MRQPVERGERFAPQVAVVRDQDPVVRPGRLLDDAPDCVRQYIDLVPAELGRTASRWNADRDLRAAADAALDPKQTQREPRHDVRVQAVPIGMVLQGAFHVVERVVLRVYRRGGRSRDLPPVIKDARDVMDP
jgi:hypothetical protein